MRYKAIPLAARSPHADPPPGPTPSRPNRPATILSTLVMAVLPILLIVPLVTVDAASPHIRLSASTVQPGAQIVVTGTGFGNGTRGTLTLDGAASLGAFVAARTFTASITVPIATTAGVHMIEARAATDADVLSTGIVLAEVRLTITLPGTTPTPTAVPATATPTPQPVVSPTPAVVSTPIPTAAPTPVQPPPATPAPLAGGLYVSTSGLDTNEGTAALPLRTIGRAVALAPSGSTIWIRGGTYAGFDVTRSGLTLRASPGEAVVVSDSSREDVVKFEGVTSGALRDLVVQGSTAQYGSGVKVKDSSGVTISGSVIRNNRTFGIVVVRSGNVRIENNEITGNADGIEERYASNGLVISGNRIHGNSTMVDAGRGREGINFYKSTGTVSIVDNLLWENGTHFEIYGASNLTFSGNVTWNGQVMETGTDGLACDGNRFMRNVSYRGAGFDGGANGMILRCASNMLVAHNTLDGFDQFAFDIVDGSQGVSYGGSIANLRIVNNVIVGGRAYSIDNSLPSSVTIDYNLSHNAGSTAVYGNHLAYVSGVGNLDTLAEFTAATGYDLHGRFGEPMFVDRSGRDYRLQRGSPAVDGGTTLLSDPFTGVAPDIGRYELP
jgi:parallel beta-helix repeat protein